MYGRTGTEKLLHTKLVCRQLVSEAAQDRITIGKAYVDCAQDMTESQSVQTITNSLNSDSTEISIPDKGIFPATCYKRL